MCKSSTPDVSGVNNAAESSAATSQEALDWYKQEAARTQGQRDTAANLDNQVAQQQLTADQQQNAAAAKTQAFTDSSVRPLEQSIIDKAQNYDTPDREQAAADSATADVRAAQAGQMTTRAQSLARMGYDPTTATSNQAAAQALAEAGAATNARRVTQTTGTAMRADAANMGLGIASNQVAQVNSGTAAGQAAAGAAGSGVNVSASGAALMGQGYGTALQGDQISGNLYGQSAQLSTSGGNGALFGMLGSLGGAAISHYSSKKLKDPGEAMPDDMALEAMTGDNEAAEPKMAPAAERREERAEGEAPVGKHTAALVSMSNDAWKYKPGVADGAIHAGPYAEEAQKKLGEKVAPKGKKLDMLESAKFNGEAIRELNARYDKLAAALGVTA